MCEEWNENKPLTQGTAERDFGMDLPETRNKKPETGCRISPSPLSSPARGEEVNGTPELGGK